MNLNDTFFRFSRGAARQLGHPVAFVLAILIIVGWAVTGPIFHWSNTWQLIINTGTTIVTFLMVFLIQNTQNRDSEAVHLKLDELIRATKRARNSLLDLENCTEEEIKKLREEFAKIAERKKIKLEIKAAQEPGRGAA
jgi:low affinity Fe/Cu permease